jgi:signal transduction histidine kinase
VTPAPPDAAPARALPHLLGAEAALVRLRWIAMLAWALMLDPREFGAPAAAVYAVYAATIAYTATGQIWVWRGRAVRAGAISTTVIDPLVVAAMCAVTGGIASDFFPFLYMTSFATPIRFGGAPALAMLALNLLLSALLFAFAPPVAGASPALRDLGLHAFYLVFAALLAGLLSRDARDNLELARNARDRARDLLWRLIRVQEDERKRIAGEIHDRMGARLFELQTGVDRCAERVTRLDAQAGASLERLGRDARACADEIRGLTDDLRPSVLDDFGIREALEQFAAGLEEHGGLAVRLDVDPGARAERPEVNVALFRILQEAVLNVRKHARARTVSIELAREGADRLALAVRDDGAGFDARAPLRARYGLLTMRERAEACGGTLEIESQPGSGTRVRAVVPAGARSS